MLDFFLVLGQVPGTHFFLTFNELFGAYSLCLFTFITRREFKTAQKGACGIPLAYWLVITAPKRGAPPKYLASAFRSRIQLFGASPTSSVSQHPKFSYLKFAWYLSIMILNSMVYESRVIRGSLQRHNRLAVKV
jgi:hypothetical protein